MVAFGAGIDCVPGSNTFVSKRSSDVVVMSNTSTTPGLGIAAKRNCGALAGTGTLKLPDFEIDLPFQGSGLPAENCVVKLEKAATLRRLSKAMSTGTPDRKPSPSPNDAITPNSSWRRIGLKKPGS